MKKLQSKYIEEKVFQVLMWIAVITVLAFVVSIIWTILVKGIGSISWDMVTKVPGKNWNTADDGGFLNAILGSLFVVIPATLIAMCVSIPVVFYMNLYRRRSNWLSYLARLVYDVLYGIPSIVYGLFGAIFFVRHLGCGKSLLAGSLTLAVMILPLVLRTSEEALQSVPDIYREGSFGLGAGRVRTVFRIVLPAAAPGLFAGVLLGIGRIVGESAALVFTSGTVAQVVTSLLDSGRTLSVHLYAISGEGLYIGETYATSLVLLLFVIALNALAGFIQRRFVRKI